MDTLLYITSVDYNNYDHFYVPLYSYHFKLVQPFNVIITYIQLVAFGFKFCVTLQSRVVCAFGPTFIKGVINDRRCLKLTLFPKLASTYVCYTFSKSYLLQILLFDYPLVLTAIILLCLELHNRNCRVVVTFSSPL